MSDSRRSSRAKKVVNYSTFGAGDDDDDFADPTPPAKKSKSTNKETKPSRVKAVEESRRAEEKTSKPKISCNRQPLDEKLFDRDLEAALKLSLLSSQESESAAEVTVQTLPDRQATPALQTSAIGDSTVNKRLLGSVVEEDDEIIELSPETADTNPRKRQRAARKSVTYEGDSDGGGEDEPWAPKDSQAESDQVSEDDEVDDDEFDPDDSDSEYESSRKKKSRKPQKTKPAAKKAPAKPRAKASTSVTPVTKKTTVSSKVVTPKTTSRSAPSTPSYSTPVRAGGVPLKRSWVPPGRSGAPSSPLSANSMKSPSGGLRLGLSRNQKVKSLHPSVTCS